MLSRVADSIYWMARYVERAENFSRLLLSTQDLMLDAGIAGVEESQFWHPILATTGDDEAYFKRHSQVTGADVTEFLALRSDNPNSILNCIRAARENARTVRDQISNDIWECLNGLRLFAESDQGHALHRTQSASFYERVLSGSYEFQGIADSTTPRGEIWHFLRLGTCLERADKMSRLLDTCSTLSLEMPPHPEARPLRWAALLRSCSARHSFQVYNGKPDPKKIIEYLLLNETLPRSVASCIAEVHTALVALCGTGLGDQMGDPVRHAGRLHADLVYTTVEEVLDIGLHEFIDDLQGRLNQIGDSIFKTFVLNIEELPDLDVTGTEDTTALPLADKNAADLDRNAQVQQQ